MASSTFIKIRQNIEGMEFLRKKVGNLVSKLRTKKDGDDQPPALLLKSLLDSESEGVIEANLHRLAAQSCEQEHFRAIVELLMAVLKSFAYKLKSLRSVSKALTVGTHLLKVGNSGFGGEFRKEEEVLRGLEGVDVHHFEDSHPREKKELEYRLQLIRQRAAFLLRLLRDPSLLDLERSRMPLCLEVQESQSESMTVTSLITPMQSPHKKNYKVKFTGVSPTSQLDERPFNAAEGHRDHPKSLTSTRF